MWNLYILFVLLVVHILLNNKFAIQENFAGFHKVNTIIRYIRRCNDAVNSIKYGVWNAVDKIIPNKHTDKCSKHHECNDKCICEQNKCKCIHKINI
jgi:hypothetical protein